MGINTPPNDRLESLYFSYRDCRGCSLHKNRKLITRGTGNPEATIIFVLDRLSPANLFQSELLLDGEGKVLESLIEYIGHDIRDFWVTSSVLCATGDLSPDKFGRDPEVFPIPDAQQLASCQPRLYEEISIIQPEVIVACGAPSLKAISFGTPPKITENLGRIIDVFIKGHLVNYPVPVMVSHSLNALNRTPDIKPGGLWNSACDHYKHAIDVAEFLRNRRSDDVN
jgi:uracil-DNA glycosylase family 4